MNKAVTLFFGIGIGLWLSVVFSSLKQPKTTKEDRSILFDYMIQNSYLRGMEDYQNNVNVDSGIVIEQKYLKPTYIKFYEN